MFEELKNEGLIVDLQNLVNKTEDFEDELNSYCAFMKEMFLGTSGVN